MATNDFNLDSNNKTSVPDTGILNTNGTGTGFLGDLSLGSILGTNTQDSFYTEFYNDLLTTGNCPSINSHWLVFINDIPVSSLIQTEYSLRDNSGLSPDTFEGASSEGRRKKGILLAQGVRHTGDGVDYSRDGYKNTGLWTGVLANGRSEVNTLDISFLESNVSFVDYALRPWTVAIAHNGLTNPDYYANNITVWHLSKMGARKNMARRKVFKYHNCFPTNIDQQEYNYSGDDVNIKRNVSFGYHYYTVEDADASVLDLLTYGEKEKQGIGKALEFFGLGNLGENALDQIRSQFGANNVGQYLNNIVERGKSFASSVVSNTVQGAITNIGGAVQGAVDGAIRDVTSQGFKAGNDAVNSIANAANDAVNSIAGSNPNADTTNNVSINTNTGGSVQAVSENIATERLAKFGYVQKSINDSDTPQSILPLVDTQDEPIEDTSKVRINIPVNPKDTPNNLENDVVENADGGITITREVTQGNPNDDTPDFSQPNRELLYHVDKNINPEDTPRYALGVQDSKPSSSFRTGLDKATDSNIDAVENALLITQQTNPNDSTIGDDLLYYVEKSVGGDVENQVNNGVDGNINSTENAFANTEQTNPNDSTIGDDLLYYNEKQIDENDSNPSESITYVAENVSENDSNPSQSVKYKQVNVSENDSNPSDSISYKQTNVSENDSNPSDSISYKQTNVSENDSNPSDSIRYNEVGISENDTPSSGNINFKKKSISNNDAL